LATVTSGAACCANAQGEATNNASDPAMQATARVLQMRKVFPTFDMEAS
jgi:hypothetical protein